MTVTRRRVLFAIFAIASFAGSALAQTPTRLYRVAFLVESGAAARRLELMLPELARLGYREGGNLEIERRNAEADPMRIKAYAVEMVAKKPDVIVVSGARVVTLLREVTTTIPIVMAPASNPVGLGFAKSLAHPGSNITGVTDAKLEVAAKRMQLLKETFPQVVRIAVWTQQNVPDAKPELAQVAGAAKQLGVEIRLFAVTELADYARAARESRQWGAQAVYVPNQPSGTEYGRQIAAIVAELRVPAIYPTLEQVEVGGLMGYSVSSAYVAGRAATYVDRILQGAKAADLPIEQPSKIELVINMKTAKALGLTIPQSLLLRADEVIQ